MNWNELTKPGAIERIALAYKEAPDHFNEIPVEQIELCRKEINRQFFILSMKRHYYFDFVTEDPYEYKLISELDNEWKRDIIRVNVSGNDSKFWGPVYNLFFRAIHDFIHCSWELDFNYKHEVRALEHQLDFSLEARYEFPDLDFDLYSRVLRSEIVYQAAYKEYFGEFHVPTQKIILTDL